MSDTTTSRSGSEENITTTEEENASTEQTAETNAAAEETQSEQTTSTEEENSENTDSTQEEENSDEGEDENKTLTAEAARKLRSENRSLRTRMRTAEDRVKELEPLAEELAGLKRTSLLSSVQAEYGLSDKQLKWLKGDSEEELKASAQEIVDDFSLKVRVPRQTVTKPLVGSDDNSQTNYRGGLFSIKESLKNDKN